MNLTFIIVMVFCTALHLTATMVVGLFARRRVQYLPLTVILGILTAGLTVCLALFYTYEKAIDVGLLYPGIVIPLACCTFLEAIIPMGLILPGYLQAGRMVKYAMPMIVIVAAYSVAAVVMHGRLPIYHNLGDMFDTFWHAVDSLARMISLAISIFYIISIFLLPRFLLRRETEIPAYLVSYCLWMVVTYALFFTLSLHYVWWLLYLVVVMVTVINIAFMLQSLEKIADSIPRPGSKKPLAADAPAKATVAPQDFNEENLFRYSRVETFMQNTDDWKDSGFTRDQLCEAVGFNRHLLLQCLRSQGFNDIHEYLTTYRAEYLARLVQTRPDDSLTQLCQESGFSTLVTARNAYLKIVGRELDQDAKRK